MDYTLLLTVIWISVSAEVIMTIHDFAKYPDADRKIILYPLFTLILGLIYTGVIFENF